METSSSRLRLLTGIANTRHVVPPSIIDARHPPSDHHPNASIPKLPSPNIHPVFTATGEAIRICVLLWTVARFIITANSIEAFVPLRPTRLHRAFGISFSEIERRRFKNWNREKFLERIMDES